MRRVLKAGLALLAAGAGGWLLLTDGAAGPRPAAAQGQDLSKVEVKVVPVAGPVSMLVGAGGNIGVSAGADGILMIDDQFAELAPKISAALASLGTPAAPGNGKLKLVINTHWHPDHTGGNAIFGMDAPIIAQTNVRSRLATEQNVLGQKHPPAPHAALPVITYDQTVSVHWNGEEIRVVHFPHGHTDGDSIIFFTGSHVVHMGDDFFAGTFPFVDLGTGGSVQGLTDNVARALSMMPADARVIPGHGPLATRADLESFHAMLVETTGIVRQRMKDGESLEKMQAEGLPEKYRSLGSGFIDTKRWIQTIHDSLSSATAGAPGKQRPG